MKSIKGKDVLCFYASGTTNEHELRDIRDKLKTNKVKILMLQCESTEKAVDVLVEIHSEINLSPFIFVIVVKTSKDESQESQTSEISRLGKVISIDAIVQLVNENSCLTFVRERRNCNESFQKLVNSHNDLMPSKCMLHDSKSFNFCLLFSFLCNNQGGSCSGQLLSTKLDTTKDFSGLTFLNFATKHGSILCLKFLNLFDWNLDERNEDGMRPLEIAAKFNRLECLKVLLEVPCYFPEEFGLKFLLKEKRNFLELTDNRDFNVLMIAIASKNEEVVKFLLKCNLDLNRTTWKGDKASDLAYKKNNFEILCELLKADSPFPRIENRQQVENSSLREIISARDDFHEFIQDNEFNDEVCKAICTFIDTNSQISCAYSEKNISALTTAVQYKKFDTYLYLRSQGFSNGIDDTFHEVCANLKSSEKNKIAGLNLSCFKAPVSEHILELLSRSKLGFNVKNRHECFVKLRNFFETLYEIPQVRPLIVVASSLKDLRIIFDFNQEYIHDMDPNAGERYKRNELVTGLDTHTKSGVKGRTYLSTNIVFIGAGNSDDFTTIGTIAHELCHCVIDNIYKNSCKPYKLEDEITENQFLTIQNELAKSTNLEKEPIVHAVFDYPPYKQTCELIVRIPQIYATYKENSIKLTESFELFKDLFSFYENFTLKTLKHHCKMIERKQQIKLNDLIGLLPSHVENFFTETFDKETMAKGKILIESNSPRLTFFKLYQTLVKESNKELEESKESKIIAKLESFINNDYFDSVRSQLTCDGETNLIVIQTNYHEVQMELIEKLLKLKARTKKNIKLVLVLQKSLPRKLSLPFDVTLDVDHKWNDLTHEFQQEILQIKVLFQGTPKRLGELLDSNVATDKNFSLAEVPCLKILKVNNLCISKIPFYISRTFEIQESGKTRPISENDLIDIFCEIKIIADVAGMGKSVSLWNFREKLSTKFPSSWIELVDLKTKAESFSKVLNKKMNEHFLEFFMFNFLCLQSEIERLVFESLYQQGKVFLLLDGFDEISPTYNESVMKLIELFMKVNGNQLFVTSRLHLVNDLMRINAGELFFKIKPFTNDDQINFIVKYWESSLTASGKEKNVDDLKSIALKVHESFVDTSFSKSLRNFIGIPLQARMLAEIYDESIVIEKLSTEIDENEKKNFIDFFEMFIDKLLKTWTKKGEIADLDSVSNISKSLDIMKIHSSAAIEFYFNVEMCKKLKLPLVKDFPVEMIVRFGILQKDESQSLMFIHATFANYFLAIFIIKNLFQDPSDQHKLFAALLELLMSILTADQHKITRKFLNDASSKPPKSLENLDFDFCEVFHKLMTEKRDFSVLYEPIKANQFHLVTMVMKLLTSNHKPDNRGLFKVLLDKNIENDLVLHLLFKSCQSSNFLKKHFDFLSVFDDSDLKSLFQEKGSCGRNLFHESLLKCKSLSSVILEKAKEIFSENDLRSYLCSKDDEGNSIFHSLSFALHESDDLKDLWKQISQQLTNENHENLWLHENKKGRNVFLESCEHQDVDEVEFVMEQMKKVFDTVKCHDILMSVDSQSCNLLHLVAKNLTNEKKTYEFFKKLKSVDKDNFRSLLFHKCDEGNSVLNHILEQNEKKDILLVFWKLLNENERKEILKSKLNSGHNVLVSLAKNTNLEVWRSFFEIAKETLSSVVEFQNLLLHKGYRIENILSVIGRLNSNPEVMLFLIHEAIQVFDFEMFESFIFWTCIHNDTPLHVIVSCNKNPKVLEAFWSVIASIFTERRIKRILQMFGFCGRHVFQRTLENSNRDMFETVTKIVKQVFVTSEAFNDFLFYETFGFYNMFFNAAYYNHPACIDFLNWAKSHATTEKLLEMFRHEINDRSLLMFVVQHCEVQLMNQVVTFMSKNFDYATLKDLILHINGENETVLNYCLVSKHMNVTNFFLRISKTVLKPEHYAQLMASYEVLQPKILSSSVEHDEEISLENVSHLNFYRDKVMEFWTKLAESHKLKEKVFEKDSEGKTLLQRILKHTANNQVFETLWAVLKNSISLEDQRELLTAKCEKGFDVFAIAAMNQHFNILEPLMNVLETVVDFKLMARQTYEHDRTIMHVVGKHNHNWNIILTLIHKLETLMDKNELKKFIEKVDSEGNSVLHYFASHNDCVVELYYFLRSKNMLTYELFTMKNKTERNLFSCAVQNHVNYFKYIWADAITKYKVPKIIEMIGNKDSKGLNVIHLMFLYSDEFLAYLLQWIKLNYSEFKSMFKNNEISILHYGAEFGINYILKDFLEFLRKNFRKDEIRIMVLENDEILIQAGRNEYKNSHELVRNFVREMMSEEEFECLDGKFTVMKREEQKLRVAKRYF